MGEDTATVRIAHLGHVGDGVAELGGHPLYVPYTLPGEEVRIELESEGRARAVEILTPSPARIAPACVHFGTCGGCALQHMAPGAYADWKRDQLAAALAARGLKTDIAPLVSIAPQTRRRASFAATRTRKGVTLGYYEPASHRIVPVQTCPVLRPEIEQALPRLGQLVAPGLSRKGRVSIAVTMTANGLDVHVTGGIADPSLAIRETLAQSARALDLARLTWGEEIIAARRPPSIDLSGVAVTPPPGAFLQACAEAEATLIRLVGEAVGPAKSVLDLFAGCGTFTLALARRASVRAIDSVGPQLEALAAAVRAQGPGLGLKPIVTERRDLAHRPLLPDEMARTEAVIFDPPRSGAKAQAEQLARAAVPKIAAVSCNPATFARDARTLVDGGYRLTHITPVDQFLWSPHIELVGVFSRE